MLVMKTTTSKSFYFFLELFNSHRISENLRKKYTDILKKVLNTGDIDKRQLRAQALNRES